MRLRGLGLFFIASITLPFSAQAYLRTLSDAGSPLYWASRNLALSGNPHNSSGLSSEVISSIFQNAAAQWSNAGSGFSVSYTPNPGTAPRSTHDGVNAVYFASQSGEQIEYGVIAVTQVLYYTRSGQIVEADVVYNDKQFQFTNNATDTGRAGYGVIYLGDVATHEFGHAIGLDHSTVSNSSMIYTAFAGAFVLGQDDITGLRTIAPSASGKGSITGTVVGTKGGMFGVHISAINQETGVVEAGTLSEPNGVFRLGDLPPGSYAVMMEPLGVSAASISTYWRNIDHRFCSNGMYAENFRRAFYAPCGSTQVTTVAVTSGRDTQLGTLTPSCTQMGNPSGVPNQLSNAHDVDHRGGARYGTLSNGQNHYYRIAGVSGTLSARAATYSIFSNVDTHVDILNNQGTVVSSAINLPDVENPMPGGHINYDSYVEARNLPYGTYYVRITADSHINSSSFPAGYELKDASGHYLLMIGVNGEHGQPSTSDMSSCVSVNNVAQGSSTYPGGGDDGGQQPGAGCATIQNPPDDLGSALGGPLMGFIVILLFHARRSLAAIRFRR